MAGRRLMSLFGVLTGRSPRCVATGTYTGTGDTHYDVKITTGGVSGAAVATWQQITAGAVVTSGTVTLTSGTAAAFGALGLSLTFYWVGRLPAGQMWRIEASDTSNLFGEAAPLDNIILEPSVPLACSREGALDVRGSTTPTEAVVIAAEGTTGSSFIDIRGFTPVFATDTAFAGTEFTFLHSFDGINSAGPLKDEAGNTVTLTGAATTLQTIVPTGNDAIALAAAYYIKIVKSTAQGAGTPTTITVGRSS